MSFNSPWRKVYHEPQVPWNILMVHGSVSMFEQDGCFMRAFSSTEASHFLSEIASRILVEKDPLVVSCYVHPRAPFALSVPCALQSTRGALGSHNTRSASG